MDRKGKKMRLYHGTMEWRARAILEEGFRGSTALDFTDKTHGIENAVCFADTIEHANQYGEYVIEIWAPDDCLENEDTVIWEGRGPEGEDEIILSEAYVRANTGSYKIHEVGQKYWDY